MGPSFLSKLVKVASPTTGSRERRPSESSSPRTSAAIPRRSQSSKYLAKTTSTTPTQSNTLTSLTSNAQIQTPTRTTINKSPSCTSFESVRTTSTQLNVTVVPPSPFIHPVEIIDDDNDDEKHSFTVASTQDTTTSPTNNVLPSMPTPPLTPTTPTPTLTSFQILSNGKANPVVASSTSLAPNTLHVRNKTSAQSMKSVKIKKNPSELNLNVNLSKTATAPVDGDSDPITNTAIVESPSDIKSLGPAVTSSERPKRRSSAQKPIGVASAIAVTGLAMANPALSPTHHSQLSPIISPQSSVNSATSKKSNGSPPYMFISPAIAQSNTSQRTRRTLELSPNLQSAKSAKSVRQRKSSFSVNSNGSEYALPERCKVLDTGSSDSGSDLDSDSESGDDGILVSGFADKRNADFHELFPSVPEGDYLVDDYGCAWQKEILIQGRLYISENHICFHANIFKWITDLSVPIYEITALEKKMTALVIPNAIQISTHQAKYMFTSFPSRDNTFDVIYNIWRLTRPEEAISIGPRSRSSIDVLDSGTTGMLAQRQNTDVAGISSKSNRSWRRSSARKPTGRASAIAASGLAMAKQALSPAKHEKAKPPKQLTLKNLINGTSTKGAKSSRQRKSSASVNSDKGSEYHAAGGDEARPQYDSGLDAGLSDSGSDLDSDLELGDDNIPVTGFAVASNKRNADFHELFPTVPEGDFLIEDYGCALQREILIQGRLYISENHICFHANIFGWITDLSIPIYEITTLEKKMTAFVIPNAIQISTRQAKYTFASFLSRDTTFDVIFNIWRLARPEEAIPIGTRSRSSMDVPDSGTTGTPAAGVAVVNGIGVVPGVNGGVVAPLKKATLCACGKDGTHYPETAMDTVMPGTPDRIHNLMFASGFMKDFMVGNQKLLDIQMSDWSPVSPGSKLLTRNMSYIKPLTASLGPKQTKCEITDETVHADDDYISTLTTTRTPEVPSGGVFSVKTRTCVMWASPVSSRVIVTTQVDWTGRSFIKGIIERSAIDGQKVYHSDLEKAMRLYIQEHQSEFLPEGIEPIVLDVTEGLSETIGVNGVHQPDTRVPEDEFKQRERERNQRGLQWAWDTFDGASQVAKQSTQGALELVRDAWDQSSSTTILWFVIVILLLSNVWTLMRMGASRDEVSRKLELRKVEDREKWVQSIVTALWEELATGKKDGHVLAETVFQHREIPSPSTGVYPTPVISHDDATTVAPEATMSVAIPLETPVGPPVFESKGWKEELEQLQGTLDTVEERVKALRESLNNLDSLD